MESGTKKPWLSKTLWLNAVVAVGALVAPGASAYVSSHPEVVMVVFSTLNMVLRVVSKDKLSLGE